MFIILFSAFLELQKYLHREFLAYFQLSAYALKIDQMINIRLWSLSIFMQWEMGSFKSRMHKRACHLEIRHQYDIFIDKTFLQIFTHFNLALRQR